MPDKLNNKLYITPYHSKEWVSLLAFDLMVQIRSAIDYINRFSVKDHSVRMPAIDAGAKQYFTWFLVSVVKVDNKTYEIGLSHHALAEYPCDFNELFVMEKDLRDLMNFNYEAAEEKLKSLEAKNIDTTVRELGLIKLDKWIDVINDAIRGHKVCSNRIKLEWLGEV